jgi:hypothetical protein
MAREVTEPTQDQYGGEVHPSWAMIGASRVSHGGAGASLFDSDILHQHTVTVRVRTASRRRDLNRDWLHPEQEFVEVEMSEAQWASFVSSMNSGSGVPCTIRRREGDYLVPEAPHAPRLQESMNEVRDAAERAAEKVSEAFAVYKAHKTVGNLSSLEAAIANMPSNITFAASSLSEHAENVVQRARADIEAMVVTKAHQLGLEPAALGVMAPQLSAGSSTETLEADNA